MPGDADGVLLGAEETVATGRGNAKMRAIAASALYLVIPLLLAALPFSPGFLAIVALGVFPLGFFAYHSILGRWLRRLEDQPKTLPAGTALVANADSFAVGETRHRWAELKAEAVYFRYLPHDGRPYRLKRIDIAGPAGFRLPLDPAWIDDGQRLIACVYLRLLRKAASGDREPPHES